MSGFYDRSGNEITAQEWSASFKNARRPDGSPEPSRHVGRTDVGDVLVSTVWLGMDHGFGDGPPLIFETMVFGGDDSEPCFRYSSEEEATAGHERIVEQLRGGVPVAEVHP